MPTHILTEEAAVWLEILSLYSHQTQQSEESPQGYAADEQNPLYDAKLCSSFTFLLDRWTWSAKNTVENAGT